MSNKKNHPRASIRFIGVMTLALCLTLLPSACTGVDERFEASLTPADSAHLAEMMEIMPTLKMGDLLVGRSGKIYIVTWARNGKVGYRKDMENDWSNLNIGTISGKQNVYAFMERVVRINDPTYLKTLALFFDR